MTPNFYLQSEPFLWISESISSWVHNNSAWVSTITSAKIKFSSSLPQTYFFTLIAAPYFQLLKPRTWRSPVLFASFYTLYLIYRDILLNIILKYMQNQTTSHLFHHYHLDLAYHFHLDYPSASTLPIAYSLIAISVFVK